MLTSELIANARASLAQNGDLPVVIFDDRERAKGFDHIQRFEVAAATPCGADDHFLLVVGQPNRG